MISPVLRISTVATAKISSFLFAILKNYRIFAANNSIN